MDSLVHLHGGVRPEGLINIRGKGPGFWIIAILAAPGAVAGVAGASGPEAGFRCALGLVGGLWAAAAMGLESRNYALSGARSNKRRVSLVTASAAMAAYTIAAAAVNLSCAIVFRARE